MKTGKIIFSLMILGLVFLPYQTVKAAVKVLRLSGEVMVYKDGAWQEARAGDILSKGAKIKTTSDSLAILLDGESRIFVAKNSEMEIATPTKNESIFSLLAGKIRAKVKLSKGSKFKVHTPVSVASVRGTDFAISSSGELVVFEGAVEFGDVMLSQSITVEAGNFARLDEAGTPVKESLSVEQMKSYKKEWESDFQDLLSAKKDKKTKQPKPEELESQEGLAELRQLKQELREMVREVKADIVITRDLTNEIKQADVATGRTLTDRYGNLVRVEQQFLRPQPDTIQLVNITKRDSYTYRGYFTNEYKGSSGARVDIIDVQIVLSKDLPDALSDWPNYFKKLSDTDDKIKPNKITFSIRNGTDEIRTEAIRRSRPEGDGDKMEGNIYINGWKVLEDYDSVSKGESRFDGDLNLSDLWGWEKSPELKVTKDGETKYLSFWTEFYCINNKGNILTKDSFTAADSNPFNILKEIAVQNTIFIKEVTPRDNNTPVVKSDFLSGRNFDIIVTPDILMNIIVKIGPQIAGSDFRSSDNSNSSFLPSITVVKNPLSL